MTQVNDYFDSVEKHLLDELKTARKIAQERIINNGGNITKENVRKMTTDCILEYACGHKADHDVSLGPILDKFVKLKDEPEVQKYDTKHEIKPNHFKRHFAISMT